MVGETLTATAHLAGVIVEYQWKANGAPIDSATSRTFTLTPAQRDKQITVTVTGIYPCVGERTSDPTEVVARECGDNLSWTLSNDVLIISGTGTMWDYDISTNAPWYSYRDSITTIVIGSSVASIGNYAFFGCDNLTSVINLNLEPQPLNSNAFAGVTLSDRKLYISTESVNDYNSAPVWKEFDILAPNGLGTCGGNLTWMLLGGELIVYGTGAIADYSGNDAPWHFHRDSITTVTIADGVTGIGNYAFSGCPGLTSVSIGNGTTRIGESAFRDCGSLTDIAVDTVNADFYSVDGVVFSKDTLILYPEGKKGGYLIPKEVTSVKDHAFYNCTGLTSVAIPPSVTGIDSYAFSSCSGLASVTNLNPESQSITGHVFAGLTLSGITLYVPAGSAESYESAAFWSSFRIRESSVSLDTTSLSDLFVGDTLQLTATFFPENAANQTMTWNSGDVSVATVSANGLVTAVGQGTAWIKVQTENGKMADSCLVTVRSQTAIPAVDAPSGQVYFQGQTLHIDSPVAERINIYSITGALLYQVEKPAGKAALTINRSRGILIVRGSSGWVRKVKN